MKDKIHNITGTTNTNQAWVNGKNTCPWDESDIIHSTKNADPNYWQKLKQEIVDTPYQETSDDCSGNLFKKK